MSKPRPTSSTLRNFRERHDLAESTFWDLVHAGAIRLTYFGKRIPRILDEDEARFLESCRKTKGGLAQPDVLIGRPRKSQSDTGEAA